MDVTLTIPDDAASRVVEALAHAGGWDGKEGNGVAARRYITTVIRQTVRNYEQAKAERAALDALDSVDEVDITAR